MPLEKLLAWREISGSYYGSEDQALFLYSLVKMYRPRSLLELGTGLAVSSFWIAQALRENGEGQILSVDDGSQWQRDTAATSGPFAELLGRLSEHRNFASFFPRGEAPRYFDWLNDLAADFELAPYLRFVNESLNLSSLTSDSNARLLSMLQADPIDILFSDFLHGPYPVLALLNQFLPHMAPSSSILINSASTSWPSYFVLEQTVAQLNNGKVPAALLIGASPERRARMMEIVATRKFTLLHMVERKDRSQNGLAWIKIEPVNVLPYPLTAMRNAAGQITTGSMLESLFKG